MQELTGDLPVQWRKRQLSAVRSVQPSCLRTRTHGPALRRRSLPETGTNPCPALSPVVGLACAVAADLDDRAVTIGTALRRAGARTADAGAEPVAVIAGRAPFPRLGLAKSVVALGIAARPVGLAGAAGP